MDEAAGAALIVAAIVWLGLLRARRIERRRELEEHRRERQAQVATVAKERFLPWARGPVGPASPLPRAWRVYVDTARNACRDYAATVGGMRPGPVRDRLADQEPALRDAAAQVDALTRRAAELDRQLRALSKQARFGPETASLRASIERSRVCLRERSTAMALVAAQAAQAAMTLSMTDADDLVSSMRDLESTVGGVAAAMQELAAPQLPAPPSPLPRGRTQSG